MENTELLPLGVEQKNDEAEHPSFDLCLGENLVSPLVAQHRQWLKSIRRCWTGRPRTSWQSAFWHFQNISREPCGPFENAAGRDQANWVKT